MFLIAGSACSLDDSAEDEAPSAGACLADGCYVDGHVVVETCKPELRCNVQLRCNGVEDACEQSAHADDEFQVSCAFEVLRGYQPGIIEWDSAVPRDTVHYRQGSIFSFGDGTVVTAATNYEEEMDDFLGSRHYQIDPAQLDGCEALENPADQFQCLVDGIEDEISECVPPHESSPAPTSRDPKCVQGCFTEEESFQAHCEVGPVCRIQLACPDGFFCDFDGLEVDGAEQIDCALELMARGEPASIRWSIDWDTAQYSDVGHILILDDGFAIAETTKFEDINFEFLGANRHELADAAHFESCAELDRELDRFNCLFEGLGEPIGWCEQPLAGELLD